jgi:hypothetical protein
MIQVMAAGMGTNMAGMICGMIERDERPNLILFADTGGEKLHTYTYLGVMNEFLPKYGWPKIEVVRAMKGPMRGPKHFESLEAQCLRLGVLPSLVYGMKTCSQKYKIRPQDTYLASWQTAIDAWARGERVVKLIGYDVDEKRRYEGRPLDTPDGKYRLRYPLVEWDWGREECVEAIQRFQLPLPGKSACFFCPSSSKKEVVRLREEYPSLYKRAVAMEDKARSGTGEGKATGLHTIKGLGRQYAWGEIDGVEQERPIDVPCECIND